MIMPFVVILKADYYSTLDKHQKKTVLSFLECLTKQLRSIDESPNSQSSVPSTPLQVATSGYDVPLKRVPLVIDPENRERFDSVVVSPFMRRNIESKARTAKNPGKFLLNKTADLIFTKEEYGASKGVSSLDNQKIEALQEYLYQKCMEQGFPEVPKATFQTVMQNKICSARFSLQGGRKYSSQKSNVS